MSSNVRPGGKGGLIAFSLVETLVVITVVSLLVSIVLASLQKSRLMAQRSMCLANMHELARTWSVYSSDFGVFPFGEEPEYWRTVRFGWGGVHWYGNAAETPVLGLPATRPLNSYVCDQSRVERMVSTFRCPADVGARLTRTLNEPWSSFAIGSLAPDQSTCFGAAGTSYEANSWMYCLPDNPTGWGAGIPPPRLTARQHPESVSVSPSRFIILGDIGTMTISRYSRSEQASRNLFAGDWHGRWAAQFAFLDGSARAELGGAISGARFSFLLRETTLPYSGWSFPDAP